MTEDLLYYMPDPAPEPAASEHPVPKRRRLEALELEGPAAEAFEEFWKVYPRRESKKGARVRFAQAVAAGTEPAAIVAAAEAFRQYCIDTGRERQFIRHAERWLSEKPWEHGRPFVDLPKRSRPARVQTEEGVSVDALAAGNALTFVPAVPDERDRSRQRIPDPAPSARSRAEVLAAAYCVVQPLSNSHMVQRVVEKAIAAGRWTDREIGQALHRLTLVDRKVTEETLRTELLYRISEHRMRHQRGEPKTGAVVYLIKADESPLVKIGTSEESLTRLYALQLSCPVELKILHEIPGSYELENALHREFSSRRRHGEWFDFSGVDPVETVMRRLPDVLRRLEAEATPR